MALDGSDGADGGPSIDDLLQLMRGARAPTKPAPDPLDQVSNWIAAQRWMPPGGGLFGSGYARYMAANAPRLPAWGTNVLADPPGSGAAVPSRAPASFIQNSALGSSGDFPNSTVEGSSTRSVMPNATSVNPIGSAAFDYGLADPEDGAQLIDVVDKHVRRLRQEYKQANGEIPRDPATGHYQDLHHIKPIADGGTQTLDNVRFMTRADHIEEHKASGDYSRWGKRASIAGAFGGRVARAIPGVDALSIVTGILSGRIRTDNPDNFINDVFGLPSKQDIEDQFERYQKAVDPNWKPGDLAI